MLKLHECLKLSNTPEEVLIRYRIILTKMKENAGNPYGFLIEWAISSGGSRSSIEN